MDPPATLPVGRITDPAIYELLRGYAEEPLPDVDFTQSAVLLAMSWARETCGFGDMGHDIMDRDGVPVLLTSATNPTATCDANCAQGEVFWAAVQIPLAQEGSACGLVLESCVMSEE
jgi:hypothetical protein